MFRLQICTNIELSVIWNLNLWTVVLVSTKEGSYCLLFEIKDTVFFLLDVIKAFCSLRLRDNILHVLQADRVVFYFNIYKVLILYSYHCRILCILNFGAGLNL